MTLFDKQSFAAFEFIPVEEVRFDNSKTPKWAVLCVAFYKRKLSVLVYYIGLVHWQVAKYPLHAVLCRQNTNMFDIPSGLVDKQDEKKDALSMFVFSPLN